MPTHILVLIHGITPETNPQSHHGQYETFRQALFAQQPELATSLSLVAEVEWGNRLGPEATRPDERLSDAERSAGALVSSEHVAAHPGRHNVLKGDLNLIPLLRPLVRRLREQLLQFGLADAIYYAAEDGETAVRAAVYGQVLAALRGARGEADVRLHVVAHSLGVTVAHDFLYGLFGKPPDDPPHYLGQAATQEDCADYVFWRAKAQAGELRLGSFVSMASQLPLFVLRKQTLVDRLARGEVLDPSDIGIQSDGQTQWLIVYDVDDPLGFATRELYGDHAEMRQVQVDAGDTPINAHMGYWTNALVIREAARVIAARTRR